MNKRCKLLKSIEGCVKGTMRVQSRLDKTTELGSSLWLIICTECGRQKEGTRGAFLKGECKCSCTPQDLGSGVLDTERPEYSVWAGMKQRCYNPNNKAYPNYGGRGIEMCAPWRESFKEFYKDMGQRPNPKLSIQRIDNDKGYCLSNCKWASAKEQASNRRENSGHKLPKGVYKVGASFVAKPVVNGMQLYLGKFRSMKQAKEVIHYLKKWEGWVKLGLSTRGSSSHKGVSFDKQKGKWKAYIPSNGKFIKLCETEDEARLAVDNYFSKIGFD